MSTITELKPDTAPEATTSAAASNSDASMQAAAAEPEAFVLDQSKRFGQQRTVQVLGDSGVFSDDEARGAIIVAKHINHALHADFSHSGVSQQLLDDVREMQVKYRGELASRPYEELVQNGTMSQLLDDYLGFKVRRSQEKLRHLEEGSLKSRDELDPVILDTMIKQEQKKLMELKGEQQAYRSSPDYTKSTLSRIEKLAKIENYEPLGKLLVQSGFVKGGTDEELSADLVNDVLGTIAARNLLMLSNRMGSENYVAKLAEHAEDASTQVRMKAMAIAVRQATQPLSAAFDTDNEAPELDRINGLKMLVSAQLHEAFSQEHTAAEMAQLEKNAQSMLKEYAQVSLSLAYDFMENGPAKDDSRIGKVKANLKNEMDRNGVELLSMSEATQKAAVLARNSAQDLLGATNDPTLTEKLVDLAQSAGVPKSVTLEAKPQLIGKESKASDPAFLLPADFLERIKAQLTASRNSHAVR